MYKSTLKPSGKLTNIQPDEVSIVGIPANKKKFILCKQENLVVAIDTDGTQAGTKILVNGEPIVNLQSFSFSFYPPLQTDGQVTTNNGGCVNCSYNVTVDSQDGFVRTETYWLSKAGEHNMKEKLQAVLKAFFGEGIEVAKADMTEEAMKAVADAVSLCDKYKEEFPQELKDAVGVLASHAVAKFAAPVKDDKPVDTQKSVITVVPVVVADKPVVKADVVPVEKPVEKVDNSAMILKAFEDFRTEMSKALEPIKTISTDVQALSKRVDAVEAMKKGVEGQDTTKITKTDEDKWPNIPI